MRALSTAAHSEAALEQMHALVRLHSPGELAKASDRSTQEGSVECSCSCVHLLPLTCA